MAEIIQMPRLSDTMTEGKVSKWHKSVGDTVKEGDLLAEIETDKAVQDFESEVNGTLLHIGTQEGNAAPVDSILAIIGESGEDISKLLGGESVSHAPKKEVEEENNSDKNDSPNFSLDQLPKGVEIVQMPRLSDTMTEGKVAKWHKNVGDTVKEGDLLAEIETDKAVQEFESEFGGTLLHIGTQEGNAAPVDSILAIIGPEGTDISTVLEGGKTSFTQNDDEKEENLASFSTEKKEDRVNEDNTTSDRVFASPLARKLAQDKGIQLNQVKGSGENGRIIKKDVESFVPNNNPIPHDTDRLFSSTETTETPNSQVRNIIAKRLSESKFTAPHYYLMVEVLMDKAIETRKELNALPDVRISFNDMVIKATAMALRKHPQVNSSWAGDKIVHHGEINIGVAVAIPDGLVVPVVRQADQLNYSDISSTVRDMAGRAKSKGLKANEMEGSTFSISNLGMFGIETFTSIINQPNSAILSVGAIIQKPVVKEGQIVVGNIMKLSLACDHRVIDGATGAEFLQTLRTYLENPVTMLLA